ncbi:MAG: aldehyde dehydrogenase family protein [Bryobacteraceae bacterium]
MPQDQDSASVQEVRAKVEKAYAAFLKYRLYDQQRVDSIVEAMGAAGRENSKRLAEMAVEETGYGNVPDKIVKNLLNSDLLPRYIRGMKTVGVLRELPEKKIVEIAEPLGVVAALVPTTNPTSTVFFKTIIALKAGNAVVISPHPRAAKCTKAAADLMAQAALQAGAPEGIVQCIASPTMESTHALMKHERIAAILATGGHAMVKAAYSSGKPAFGVGPGNVPAYIERSAPVAEAVAKVVAGKAFDYGTVCSSEQALVCEESIQAPVATELKRRKAFFCDDVQKQAIAKVLLKDNFRINPDCVALSPVRLARAAGFEVPADTSILVVELQGVGKDYPLSVEKLSPVLALYFVRDHAAALDTCEALLRFGGLGHTCVIHSQDDARIREFAVRMPAMRVLVNTGAPAGSTGMTTNLQPSMTLGCGAMAGNVTGDNVGPQHLINIKRLAWMVRTAEEAMPMLAAPPPVAEPARLDRQTIAAAVESYLAQRGIAVAPAAAPAAPSAAAQVVDRFLASRRTGGSSPLASCPASCPCLQTKETPQAAPPQPPAPQVAIVDFVCEADVRDALRQSRKIFIGPRTIVTPSARDLGRQHDILVVAQR